MWFINRKVHKGWQENENYLTDLSGKKCNVIDKLKVKKYKKDYS